MGRLTPIRQYALLVAAVAVTVGFFMALSFPNWWDTRPTAPVEAAPGEIAEVGGIEARLLDVWRRSTFPNGEAAPEGTAIVQVSVELRADIEENPYCEVSLWIDGLRWSEYNKGYGTLPGLGLTGFSSHGCTVPFDAVAAEGYRATWLFVVPEDSLDSAREAGVELVNSLQLPRFHLLRVEASDLT
ncbi:MAG: hypothetical protein Q4G64_03200 [bacterium]|nr:hypothetical protein [bacterium]